VPIITVVYYRMLHAVNGIELRKVLFLAPSVCVFLFVYEISRESLNGFGQIHTENVFISLIVFHHNGSVHTTFPRSDEFEGQGHHGQKRHFGPLRPPACGLCLVKHL